MLAIATLRTEFGDGKLKKWEH